MAGLFETTGEKESGAPKANGIPSPGLDTVGGLGTEPFSWGRHRAALVRFGAFVGILSLLLCVPLIEWVQFALKVDLYSHVLLIPVISAGLVWMNRDRWPVQSNRSNGWAAGFAVAGLLVLGAWWAVSASSMTMAVPDRLALFTLAFVLFIWSGISLCLGMGFFRRFLFPIGFLLFAIPFPNFVRDGIELTLQYASAEAFDWMIRMSGTPVFRDGLIFEMPRGLRIQVATECSGIRSSWVLFITSLLAGHLFLRSRWRTAVLAFCVFPIGVLRNGFRILAISLLTLHVDPEVINGPLHSRGGPVFFVLSLIPLFLLLYWFRRSEVKRTADLPARRGAERAAEE